MDRTKLLLSLFDSTGFGLEIGPSYNPLLPKSSGYNVETVDQTNAAALRKKYRDNASQIEEVDYVSDGQGLLELIGKPGAYDFIVASHVIEHVTDIVRFIQDCEALLKPEGVLVLAVPDKRFCFDTLRPVSTIGQALQAYAERRTRHTPGMIFDQVLSESTKAKQIVWIEPTLDDIEMINMPNDANALFQSSQSCEKYTDIHGWQFTPAYFRYFVKTLRSLNYFSVGEKDFHKNDSINLHLHEFYITLSKNAPVLDLSDVELLKESEKELREIEVSRNPHPLDVELNNARGEIDVLAAELNFCRSEIAALKMHNAALIQSNSWKLTAPLRFLRSVLQ